MTTPNPTPTQPETLEGCPFCPAELTPLPSAHLPADLHEQASEWYQITHNVGCYLLLLGFGDYPIHRDRLKAWNTRRSTGAVEVWRVVEIINRFSVCRDHDQPSHCVQCDLRHKAIAAVRAAATSSPTPAESAPWSPNAAIELLEKWLQDPEVEHDEGLERLLRAINENSLSNRAPAGERRLLTPEELADIERFQQQRRKSPVAEDAWLYVAEIDRLLTHIRLDREQLENEIFQDATDPAFTSDSARRAAEEIADLSYNRHRDDKVAQYIAIISKHFAAAPADNDAESLELLRTSAVLCISGDGQPRVSLLFKELKDAQAVHEWLVRLVHGKSTTPTKGDR